MIEKLKKEYPEFYTYIRFYLQTHPTQRKLFEQYLKEEYEFFTEQLEYVDQTDIFRFLDNLEKKDKRLKQLQKELDAKSLILNTNTDIASVSIIKLEQTTNEGIKFPNKKEVIRNE